MHLLTAVPSIHQQKGAEREDLAEAVALGVAGPTETRQNPLVLERERKTACNRVPMEESGAKDAFEVLGRSRSSQNAGLQAVHVLDTAALYDIESVAAVDAAAAFELSNP